MSSSPEPTHRVVREVTAARAQFSALADAPTWSLTPTEAAETLLELTRLRAQVEAFHLQLLAQVDTTGVASDAGTSSTANWYADRACVTRRQANREVWLAQQLVEHEPVAHALAQGLLHVEQAHVVLTAVAQLPDEVTVEQCDEAEGVLVMEATKFDAKRLRVLGRHLVEVVAPEIAEAHTAKLLEAEERAAAAEEVLYLYDKHNGTHGIRGTISDHHAAMLKKALLAFAAPKHQAASGPLGERKPTPERMGRAFGELIETYPVDRLPDSGGLNATLVVTMSLRSLLGSDQPATLDTGGEISASLARKLACEAGLVPVVLDGQGRPLDVGRKQRLFTPAQRIALGLRDKGCTAEGCDWPPGMCHAHHDVPWHAGQGPTDLANGRLLCPFHHARAHDSHYEVRKAPGNKVGFYKRE